MDAIEYNIQFDERLYTTYRLNSDDLRAFDEAYRYDATSSINWLISKLKILKSILSKGNTLEIEETGRIFKHTEFKEWVSNRYGSISEDLYPEKVD